MNKKILSSILILTGILGLIIRFLYSLTRERLEFVPIEITLFLISLILIIIGIYVLKSR